MIGALPTSVTANGQEYPLLNTDFRTALVIIEAFEDPNLSSQEKAYLLLNGLIGIDNIPKGTTTDQLKALAEACITYLDGGTTYKSKGTKPKLMDWTQDEQLIFSAVNHVANKELREVSYCHWWTFLGYFNEIHEGLFSNVIGIRQKKAKKKKLDKVDQEFYASNKEMIDLKKKLTSEEQKYKDELNAKFK